MHSFACVLALMISAFLSYGCSAPAAKPDESQVAQKAAAKKASKSIGRIFRERGALTYVIQPPSAKGTLTRPAKVRGLVLLRDRTAFRPLGGPYFDDRLGNLVRFGAFDAPSHGGQGTYALTFLRNGGVQIALDLRNDRVIDVVVDRLPGGALGFFIDPTLQRLLDCLASISSEDANYMEAVNACLGKAGIGDSDGGPGIGAGAVGDYRRLGKPDCGKSDSGGGGLLGKVAQETGEDGWDERARDLWRAEDGAYGGDRYSVRYNADGAPVDLMRETLMVDSEGDTSIYITDIYDNTRSRDGSYTTAHSRTTIYQERQADGRIRTTETSTSNGTTTRSVWDRDPTTGEDECVAGACLDAIPEETGDELDAPEPTGGGDPGPECQLEGNCPYEDPRCAPPQNDAEALWDCIASGISPFECLRRIEDALYAATGCERVDGPADQPIVRCPPSPPGNFARCVAEGRSPVECLREQAGDPEHESSRGEDDDILSRFRTSGSSDVSFLATTPVGALLFGLCAADGPNCPPMIGTFEQGANLPADDQWGNDPL